MAFWDELSNYIGRHRRGSPSQPSGPMFNNIGDYYALDPTGQLATQDSHRYEGQGPFGYYPGGTSGGAVGGNVLGRITGMVDDYNASNNEGLGVGIHSGVKTPWWMEINKVARGLPGLGGEIGSGLAGSVRPKGPPGIDDILRRLEELQNPEQYMQSDAELRAQAHAAAASQYDPLINALQREEGAATNRANVGKAEIGKMFSALSSSLQGDIPAINQQYAGDKAQTAKLYNDQKTAVKQQYAKSQADQAAMMKQLGIEAAAGSVLPQQANDANYFVNMAGQENATQQSALGQEQQGAVTYTREGSQLARTEGTQRQADLAAQLRDLLAQYQGKIGDYRAAESQAETSGLGQLRSQMMKDAYDRADRSASNYMDMINLGRALKKDEQSGAKAAVTSTKSPADVASRALSLGMNPHQAQSIENVFLSTIGSDKEILSGKGIFGYNVPKEELAKRVVEAGRAKHFSQPALNTLMTIALEYFGRR
jgi:hypothetical protein